MSDGIKVICQNKKAYQNYSIEEKLEAGIVLWGTEVKALRATKANIKDAYAIFKTRELFLLNAHISAYAMGNRENHEPLRTRKLLMHRKQLDKLWGKSEVQGYNIIPLKLYFKKGVAKVELGVGRSRKKFDKRAVVKKREDDRQMARALKRNR